MVCLSDLFRIYFLIICVISTVELLQEKEIGPKYFSKGKTVTLSCDGSHSDQIVPRYTWTFSTRPNAKVEEEDVGDYPEKYEYGKKLGNILLLDPIEETVSCIGFLANGQNVHSNYQLIEAKPSSPPSITMNGKEVTGFESVPKGNFTFVCIATGGIPNPKITLQIGNSSFQKNNVTSITVNPTLTFDVNQKNITLNCIVEDFFSNQTAKIILDILSVPMHTPEKQNTTAVVDKDYIFHFQYIANPEPEKSAHLLLYSSDCLNQLDRNDQENRYSVSGPQSKGNGNYVSDLKISRVDEMDLKTCFCLNVTNSQGSTLLCQPLFRDPVAPSLWWISLIVLPSVGILVAVPLLMHLGILPSCRDSSKKIRGGGDYKLSSNG